MVNLLEKPKVIFNNSSWPFTTYTPRAWNWVYFSSLRNWSSWLSYELNVIRAGDNQKARHQRLQSPMNAPLFSASLFGLGRCIETRKYQPRFH